MCGSALDPRKHSAAGVAYTTRWACAQVVIAVVDRGLRPEVPAVSALPTAPLRQHSAYVALMRRCWATDPAQRPAFEAVISELRCGPACEGRVMGSLGHQPCAAPRPWCFPSCGAARLQPLQWLSCCADAG